MFNQTTNQLIRKTKLRIAQSSGIAHIQLVELEQGQGGKQGHVLVLREYLNAYIIVAEPVKSVKVIWFYIWGNLGRESWNTLFQDVQSTGENVSNKNTNLPSPWKPSTQIANRINFVICGSTWTSIFGH